MVAFREFSSRGALEDAAAALLREAFAAVAAEPVAIMLTGGTTPQAVHQRLAREARPAAAGLHLMISDERHVPADSPAHNFARVRPLADALGVPAGRCLHPDTDGTLEQDAAQYDAALRQFLRRGRIALGILGLGADGHLASLFSDADAAAGAGRLAAAVQRPQPPHRISVTPDLLRQVGRLVFWVAGPDKVPVLRRWRTDPATVVAARVVRGFNHVECWTAP